MPSINHTKIEPSEIDYTLIPKLTKKQFTALMTYLIIYGQDCHEEKTNDMHDNSKNPNSLACVEAAIRDKIPPALVHVTTECRYGTDEHETYDYNCYWELYFYSGYNSELVTLTPLFFYLIKTYKPEEDHEPKTADTTSATDANA